MAGVLSLKIFSKRRIGLSLDFLFDVNHLDSVVRFSPPYAVFENMVLYSNTTRVLTVIVEFFFEIPKQTTASLFANRLACFRQNLPQFS